MIFNAFVFLQLFNEINSRKVNNGTWRLPPNRPPHCAAIALLVMPGSDPGLDSGRHADRAHASNSSAALLPKLAWFGKFIAHPIDGLDVAGGSAGSSSSLRRKFLMWASMLRSKPLSSAPCSRWNQLGAAKGLAWVLGQGCQQCELDPR